MTFLTANTFECNGKSFIKWQTFLTLQQKFVNTAAEAKYNAGRRRLCAKLEWKPCVNSILVSWPLSHLCSHEYILLPIDFLCSSFAFQSLKKGFCEEHLFRLSSWTVLQNLVPMAVSCDCRYILFFHWIGRSLLAGWVLALVSDVHAIRIPISCGVQVACKLVSSIETSFAFKGSFVHSIKLMGAVLSYV